MKIFKENICMALLRQVFRLIDGAVQTCDMVAQISVRVLTVIFATEVVVIGLSMAIVSIRNRWAGNLGIWEGVKKLCLLAATTLLVLLFLLLGEAMCIIVPQSLSNTLGLSESYSLSNVIFAACVRGPDGWIDGQVFIDWNSFTVADILGNVCFDSTEMSIKYSLDGCINPGSFDFGLCLVMAGVTFVLPVKASFSSLKHLGEYVLAGITLPAVTLSSFYTDNDMCLMTWIENMMNRFTSSIIMCIAMVILEILLWVLVNSAAYIENNFVSVFTWFFLVGCVVFQSRGEKLFLYILESRDANHITCAVGYEDNDGAYRDDGRGAVRISSSIKSNCSHDTSDED